MPIYAHDASSWPAPRWRKGLLTDELERFRVVVETLADDFDVMQVALAAAKLAPTRSTTRCDGRHGNHRLCLKYPIYLTLVNGRDTLCP